MKEGKQSVKFMYHLIVKGFLQEKIERGGGGDPVLETSFRINIA